MTGTARSEFQNALREALDTYYIGWHIRHSKNRPTDLPDADTLNSWITTDQTPQVGTFTKFIERSRFPENVRKNLLHLFQQLPRRTRRNKQAPTTLDFPSEETPLLSVGVSDRLDTEANTKALHMKFQPPIITTIAIGVDLAGYSKQDAVVRDSQGKLTVFLRYKTGELGFIQKDADASVWNVPEIFDRTENAENFFHVAAAIDTADNIHVIWGLVPEASDAKYGVLDGTVWLHEEVIATGTFARNIAVDSANHPHIVWTNVDLFHMTSNGQRWFGPKSVGRGFWHPDIVIDHNDDVFLFLNSGGFRPQTGVTVYAIDNTFDHWKAPVPISTSPFWSGAVSAAINRQGDIYTAWVGTPTADGGDDQIFFSRRINGKWQPPFPIGDVNWAASSTGQESPAVGFDANDVFYVFWRGLSTKNRPMIFGRALVPETSEIATKVKGWSKIITLDDSDCSDVWWPSVTDGKAIHRGIGVDVVWRANRRRDWVINHAHVSYP